jgi:hypothetical protein
VGLERGPLSLVSTTEELLERKSSGSGLEIREYGSRNPSCWPHGTLYPQRLILTSLTIGGRSVGIVRSRTQTTEHFYTQTRNESKQIRIFNFSKDCYRTQFYDKCRLVSLNSKWFSFFCVKRI